MILHLHCPVEFADAFAHSQHPPLVIVSHYCMPVQLPAYLRSSDSLRFNSEEWTIRFERNVINLQHCKWLIMSALLISNRSAISQKASNINVCPMKKRNNAWPYWLFKTPMTLSKPMAVFPIKVRKEEGMQRITMVEQQLHCHHASGHGRIRIWIDGGGFLHLRSPSKPAPIHIQMSTGGWLNGYANYLCYRALFTNLANCKCISLCYNDVVAYINTSCNFISKLD